MLKFIFSFARKDETFVLELDEYALKEKSLLPFGTVQIIDARFGQGNIRGVVKDLSFKVMTEDKMTVVLPCLFQGRPKKDSSDW